MSMKRLFAPITKVDAVKGMVYGVLASSALDRSGEIFDYVGSKPYFEKWSAGIHKATDGKSLGNLRSMHGSVAAGKFTEMVFNDDDEQIEVAAKIVDPTELQKVIEGVYTGFSIGGKYITRKKEGDATKYVADPYEGSLVDLPCIPDATFEVIKAAGDTEVRKFHVVAPEAKEPTNDEVAAKARDLAKVAGAEDKWLDHLEPARKMLSAAPAADAELEPQHVLDLAVTAVDDATAAADIVAKNANGTSDDLGAVQQWTHPRLPGQGFAKKSDLRQAIATLDATEAAAKLAGPVTDALKDLTAALDVKDPAGVKKNTSDNPDFAGKDKAEPDPKAKDAKKPGAKDAKTKAKEEADKSKPPMKSAVDVIARAKAWQAETIPSFEERREILKAAADHDAVAALPAGFIDEPAPDDVRKAAGDLQKSASLYQVSSLISLVAQLESFHTGLGGNTGGGYYYGDGDRITVVDCSPEIMTRISTMCDELGAAAASLLDEVLSAMKAEDATKALGRGTVLADLHKIGARNSSADKTRLTKAHDLLAEIAPEMCGTDKAAGDGDLTKVLKAQEVAFTKTLGDIADVLKEVGERVKRIEAQPLPGRPTSVNVLEKGVGHVLDGLPNFDRDNADRANREAFASMAGEMTRFAAPAVR